MIRRHQLFRHEPHNEIYGDCHRTAIACLMDLEPWQVPHFAQLAATQPGYDWEAAVAEFLETHGLCSVDVSFGPDNGVEGVFAYMQSRNPGIRYLLGGMSPRGTNHTVVACGGGYDWDPHPDGGFLVGPLTNGHYEITFLLPLSMQLRSAA
ncbi:hypothetical protein GGR60_000890 [Xanthomonas arboricola]|uniref:hypothetical protein n=1 Tax=Xanthomonas euroxanthea TaxID=2259622 RepID=UPI00142F6918|nr:hypothetical protein [Xanthomonas euroxanthea]NJC36400.1 hypothetical protein [Xanthomonas euroxanthea]